MFKSINIIIAFSTVLFITACQKKETKPPLADGQEILMSADQKQIPIICQADNAAKDIKKEIKSEHGNLKSTYDLIVKLRNHLAPCYLVNTKPTVIKLINGLNKKLNNDLNLQKHKSNEDFKKVLEQQIKDFQEHFMQSLVSTMTPVKIISGNNPLSNQRDVLQVKNVFDKTLSIYLVQNNKAFFTTFNKVKTEQDAKYEPQYKSTIDNLKTNLNNLHTDYETDKLIMALNKWWQQIR